MLLSCCSYAATTAAACWNKIETWGACGGKYNCPGGTSNCNVPWKGHCCNSGDVCTRQNDNWWRCEPLDRYTESHTCETYAGTWDSCGDRKCCSTPGDICVYKTDEWSRCEPTGNQAPGSWVLLSDSACVSASNNTISTAVIAVDGVKLQHVSCTRTSRHLQGPVFLLIAAAPPRGNPPKPLEIRGSQIVAAGTDEQVQLRGINWFGYNVVSILHGTNYSSCHLSWPSLYKCFSCCLICTA